MDRKRLLLWTLIVEGAFLVMGWMLMGSDRVWETFYQGVSWPATAYAGLYTLPMLAVLYAMIEAPGDYARRMRGELDEKLMPIFANCKVIDLLIISILAGAGEEFLFRGWLQELLTDSLGVWIGIGITSLVFGLSHRISTDYAIYAGFIGLYLGVIYEMSGNLYLVAAIHALYDFVALIYLKREKTSSPW